jgi:UDP-2-acetamido-3-amino-2,3-dideoxy-glucuronate N-acetyltransferase
MAGHILLYHPAIQKIKRLINEGIIGDIKFIHCQRLNFGVVRNDVDVFSSLAPHDISLVQYFLNEEKYLSMNKLESSITLSKKNDYSSTLIEYPKK